MMRAFRYEGLPSRVVFGAGCAAGELDQELERLGARRVLLVVTDQELALATRLTGSLASVVGTFTGVRPHVPVGVVDEACALAVQVGADALLCIGGGSTTGTAKAVALRTGLPIVAVPTTYAGSEVTPVWGTTEGARKTTGRSPVVLPRTVLYDPDLTTTLPVGLTAASAMNAMAHCIEAFYAAGSNPVTDLVAAEGVRALASGLPPVMAEAGHAAGRADLLYGAYLAGSAFAVAGSGLHHRICHVLGGAFDLPHAETHTIVLPHVTAFNEPAVPGLSRAAAALGAPSATAGLGRLVETISAPTALLDVGMGEADLDLAVALVVEKDLTDNPRPVAEADVRAILTGALHGRSADLVAAGWLR